MDIFTKFDYVQGEEQVEKFVKFTGKDVIRLLSIRWISTPGGECDCLYKTMGKKQINVIIYIGAIINFNEIQIKVAK